ncbi:hypothetical protein [Kribbella pratensis]|uniref:hypothetical protein n=1 Tax=Kribbella pratensis TaxID=2512112 RepID=UPI001064F2E8|nr:hypothetical protein [Kribbella pratensis]
MPRSEIEAGILTVDNERRIGILAGVAGAGKTTVLAHLLAKPRENHKPQRVSLENYDPGHHGERGPRASVGAVQGSFQQYRALLEKLLVCYAPGAVDDFRREAMGARNSEVTNARISTLEDSMKELSAPLRPTDLADAWRAAAAVIGDCFLRHWNADTGDSIRLLLLDNADAIADQDIGDWLGTLLPQLEKTIVVATQQPDAKIIGESSDDILAERIKQPSASGLRVSALDNFEQSTVIKELARLGVRGQLAQRVFDVSAGHPATLSLVYELLWSDRAVRPDNPESLLTDLPEPQHERIAVLVDRLVERSGRPVLRTALWAAAVPRTFDADLLRHLLDGQSLSADEQAAIFEDLGKMSLLVEDVSADDSSEAPRHSLRLHSYIRNAILDRMTRLHSDLFTDLNRKAAEYYRQQVLEYKSSTATYSDASVYEDTTWQGYKREWLYHNGLAVTSADKEDALVEFATVFAEAHWWWANYIHFDFCDEYLTDLAQLAVHRGDKRIKQTYWPELGVLYDSLRLVLREYPPRSVKPADADWQGIRDALAMVEDVCGLTSKPAGSLSERQQRLAGLLALFTAHTWRYPPTDRSQADPCYVQAAAALADPWDVAWVEYERADLHLECGELTAVQLPWEKAAAFAQPGDEPQSAPDDELISNLHRVRADYCWTIGDYPRAAASYGKAVLHAYLFHLAGPAPDEYTLQFYVDVRARALSRLFGLDPDQRPNALKYAAIMARAMPIVVSADPSPAQVLRSTLEDDDGVPRAEEAIGRLLDRQQPLLLAQELFPRGPQVEELHMRRSDFSIECRRYVAAVKRTGILTDLTSEVWP